MEADLTGQDNVFAYRAPIWQRFRAPCHGGRLSGAQVLAAEVGSAATRSVLRLQIELDGARVLRARFQAYGCPTAIAVGEWLAEQLEARPRAAWPAIDVAAIRDALEIPEDKAHCALMGEDALRALEQKIQQRP